MAYDPMSGFEIGQSIGKAKKSSLGRTASYMSDLTRDRDKQQTKTSPLELLAYKNMFPSAKEKAVTENLEARTDWMKNAQGGLPEEEGLVLDRIGPTGPTFVNQDERLRMKTLSSQASELPKLDRAFDAVKSLKDQYNRSISPVSIGKKENVVSGWARKQMQGIGANISSASGTNPEMNRYKANKAGFASLISKGGFMEAGVLTQEDIERILNILPSEYSTKEESDIAWNEIEGVLSSARNRFESAGGTSQFGSNASQPPAQEQSQGSDAKTRLQQKLAQRGWM